MLKILHVIPSIAPVRGGPSLAIVEMVKALRSQDVEVEIVTTNDNGCDLLNVPLCQKTEYAGVTVRFFPRFSPQIHSVREFAFSTELTKWLWKNITHYDLLHIHAIFSYPSTVAMLIARLKGIPYICRPLGQLCNWSLQQGYQKKQAYLNVIERANLNGSQALHFTTKQEQQEASNLNLKCPSFILPHGLSIPAEIPDARKKLRQQLNLEENEPVILFLSRLHQKKGLDYLIPALGKLTKTQFTFILAGNGDLEYETEITRLLQQHNIESQTRKVGFVQGEYKNLLLQGADLFALTSHSENFGIVVLEALAARTPALVTPGVALASVLKQGRVGYIANLNIDSIAESIQYCLDNLSETQAMGERARNLIFEHYTWERITLDIKGVYTSILKKSSTLNQYQYSE